MMAAINIIDYYHPAKNPSALFKEAKKKTGQERYYTKPRKRDNQPATSYTKKIWKKLRKICRKEEIKGVK